MGMLSRYQKTGGFNQILQLIETCGKQKQDNFLQMIEKEDPRWAQAIREKMLSIEKIFSWSDEVLAEVAARLQELTIATAMHGLKTVDTERLLKTFTHTQKRNIEDLFKSKASTPAEISSAFLKILQEVRQMIIHGYIRLEKFAPEMAIPEDFEEKLGKTVFKSGSPSAEPEVPNLEAFGPAAHSAPAHAAAHGDSTEVISLRARLQAITQENTQLKSEVRIMRDKLTQIKKIA